MVKDLLGKFYTSATHKIINFMKCEADKICHES
jgi:hypothetical protein